MGSSWLGDVPWLEGIGARRVSDLEELSLLPTQQCFLLGYRIPNQGNLWLEACCVMVMLNPGAENGPDD